MTRFPRPLEIHSRQAGVTLVEVIVALAIIAVMSGIAALSVGAFDRTRDPGAEAQRMAARINLAGDVALIEGRSLNLSWDEGGYSVDAIDPAADVRGAAAVRHDIPEGLRLSGSSTTGSLAIGEASGAISASFLMEGRDGAWKVDFDGLAASANPVPPT